MATSEATVFIVDDDEAVRDSLGLLLRSAGYRARCYGSAKDFLKAFDPRDYGCLVLDIRMPGMTGLELQKHLTEIGCTIPIVFITGHGDIPMAVEAVRLGAVDFLQKPFRDQELVDRINDAMKQAAQQREGQLERLEILDRVDSLTAREKQVMGQVVLGKANKVIAGDLGVSQRTVEIHRARVMEKMQANSLAHLVRMVMVAENQPGA
ncbi:response regulator FixJ [Wenzhouxiangella sp. XN24]|uniref:response regulator FixJ n=1 Tax=Wenzhouxiangella sp. XN24 TaxID=2713569 RepID=UPI0013ED6538|nr:response regulator FixJ [Wenzhouxiangella sp. XN24]NGX17582.1 response regulator transcription factor [Wenzhouxiangella sp. XN24]